jgi:hypothetical protein
LPKDVARQEANHADNERCHAQRQRRQVRSTARATATARGEQTPSVSESIGDNDEEEDEDEEEGEIISSPHSPPPQTSPYLVPSSAKRRGSLLVLTGRNVPGQTPREGLACSLVSR